MQCSSCLKSSNLPHRKTLLARSSSFRALGQEAFLSTNIGEALGSSGVKRVKGEWNGTEIVKHACFEIIASPANLSILHVEITDLQ